MKTKHAFAIRAGILNARGVIDLVRLGRTPEAVQLSHLGIWNMRVMGLHLYNRAWDRTFHRES